MASVRIRRATPEDAEAITFIYMQSAELHAQLDPERNHVPDRASIVERYRTGGQHPGDVKEAITFAAEQSGRVAGFLDAWLMHPFDPMYRPAMYCFIADVAVEERWRGTGIGRELMRAAEQWAAERGAEYVLLEYHAGNKRAAALYAELGYRSGSVVACKRLG
jgi:ribosomal protein S18 acetylase RimI-like enzyme